MKKVLVLGLMMALTTEMAKAEVCQSQAESFAAQSAQSISRSTARTAGHNYLLF